MSWIAFLRGFAAVLDLGGTLSPPVELGTLEDDWRALYYDQLAVADDTNSEGFDELDCS